jgi:uncharacterized hydrophobic protein (TIGR00341 family)
MTQRLIQISFPVVPPDDIARMTKDIQIVNMWQDQLHPERNILQLVAPAEDCERIMDHFQQRFGNSPGFNIMLMSMEAVVPRPKPDPKQEKKAETDTPGKNRPAVKNKHRVSREELYADMNAGIIINRAFIALTILSSIVAAIGLMRNDLAIIIGAMVIAPLLTPNMALALATTLGDSQLGKDALKTNFIGILLAISFSVCVGVIFNVDAGVPAIASRTSIAISDIILALAAGSAGALAFTTGFSGALIGVMVAVALMPPLVTVGMLFGSGQFALSMGAFMLFAANLICVNLAGVVTFILQGVRPRTWWEAERAKKATVRAAVIWSGLLLALILILYFRAY